MKSTIIKQIYFTLVVLSLFISTITAQTTSKPVKLSAADSAKADSIATKEVEDIFAEGMEGLSSEINQDKEEINQDKKEIDKTRIRISQSDKNIANLEKQLKDLINNIAQKEQNIAQKEQNIALLNEIGASIDLLNGFLQGSVSDHALVKSKIKQLETNQQFIQAKMGDDSYRMVKSIIAIAKTMLKP